MASDMEEVCYHSMLLINIVNAMLIIKNNVNYSQMFVTETHEILVDEPQPEPPIFTRALPEKSTVLEGRTLTLDVKVG